MQKKDTKNIMVQGTVYLVVLILAVIAMLTAFSYDSRRMLTRMIETRTEKELEAISADVDGQWNWMVSAADVSAALLGEGLVNRTYESRDAMKVLAQTGGVYLAIYYEIGKSGVTSEGSQIDMEQTAYFGELEGETSFFLPVLDDGVTGEGGVMYVSPVKEDEKLKGYVLVFLKNGDTLEQIRGFQYKNRAFFAIVNKDGETEYLLGNDEQKALASGNVWEQILADPKSKSQKVILERKIEKQESGSIHTMVGPEGMFVCVSPMKGTDRMLVMGVEEDYLSEEENALWRENGDFQVWIVVALVLIFVVFLYYLFSSRYHAREQSRELEDKADTDQLTGLNNKLATERKIKEYLANKENGPGVLFIVDVDNFKKINDSMGHSFGDEVLSELGMRLQSMFRVTDIIGRTGGDEMMIFLKNIKDEAVIRREGEKLEYFFRHFEVGEYVKYSVTASLGAAVYPKDAEDFESLYKAADSALYTATRNGKNRLAFYGEDKGTSGEKAGE